MLDREITKEESAIIILTEAFGGKHTDIGIAQTLHGSYYKEHYTSSLEYADALESLINLFKEPELSRPLVAYLNRKFEETTTNARQGLHKLSPRKAQAIQVVFGWDDGRLKSYPEAARELGLASRSRVRELCFLGISTIRGSLWIPYHEFRTLM